MSWLRRVVALVLLALHVLASCGAVMVCVEADGATNVEWALGACCEAPATTDASDPMGDAEPCRGCTDRITANVAAERPRQTLAVAAPLLTAVLGEPLDPLAAAPARPAPPSRGLDPPRDQRPSALRS